MDCVPAKEGRVARLNGGGKDVGGVGLPAIGELEPLSLRSTVGHGDGAHGGSDVGKGDPGGEHEVRLAGFPTAALGVPVIVESLRSARGFFPKELVEPETE